jgi:beta-lactam-binding protein with PASTA domain
MHAKVILIIGAVSAALVLAGCGGQDTTPAPATVTVQAPAPAVLAPATPVSPSTVTLPDVVGQNGAIAEDALRSLGLSKLQLAADKNSGKQVVISSANWTVTKIEPRAGTKVRTDQTVVITMTK